MGKTEKQNASVDGMSLLCFGMKLSEAHKKEICIQCKKKIKKSSLAEIDQREYEISGLCPICQKEFFD